MKKRTITALSAGVLMLVSTLDSAAQKASRQGDKGFWQLVSNTKAPRSVNVQFYTTDGALMYEERVEGRRLNTARRKVCRQLDNALAQVFHHWQKDGAAAVNGKDLLARRTRTRTNSCTESANQ